MRVDAGAGDNAMKLHNLRLLRYVTVLVPTPLATWGKHLITYKGTAPVRDNNGDDQERRTGVTNQPSLASPFKPDRPMIRSEVMYE